MGTLSQPTPSSVTVSLPKLILRTNGEPFEVVPELPGEVLGLPVAHAAAKGIILRGDDVLLLHGDAGTWCLPGCDLSDGEEPSDAIRRGLAAMTGFPVGRATHAVSAWEACGTEARVTHAFLCEGGHDGERHSVNPRLGWRPMGVAVAGADGHACDMAILRTLFPYG